MPQHTDEITGLTDAGVTAARAQYGANVQAIKNKTGLFAALQNIVKEPMFILLGCRQHHLFYYG